MPATLTLPPLAASVPGAVDELHDAPVTLHQVQHDTADRRLAGWGADLTVRLDGPDRGWRLVLPPDEDLDEPDVVGAPLPEDGPGEQAPAELLDLVRALVRDGTVQATVRTSTTSTTLRLVDEAGRELAAVHDERTEVRAGTDEARHERRLRIVGARPTVDATRAVARLVDALQVGPAATAEVVGAGEVVRGRGARPEVVVPPRPHRHSTAGQVLTYALAVHVRELLLADVAVRRDRADAVHRLRVAARTVRSVLRTFADLCDETWATRLGEELAVTAATLGAVRDTEVLYLRLEADAERLAAGDRARALHALDALLRPQLLAARACAQDELGSARYLQLVADLVDAVHHPRLTAEAERDAARVLPGLVAHDWARLVRAVQHLRRAHVDPRERAWHRARILAKRTRYGVEATAPSLRRGARRWVAALPRLTDLLGELHDGVVATELLRRAAAESDASTRPALGRLLGLEDAAVDAAAQEFLDRWPRVRRTLDRHPIS